MYQDVGPEDDSATPSIHLLRPAPPVRAFLVAAVLSVLGAVLTVTASAQHWPVAVLAIGVVLVVLGLALCITAVVAMRRMRVRAELTDVGYRFETPGGVREGRWADTVTVTASGSGHRISLVSRDETTQHVLSPVGAESPEMEALQADLVRRLEASRRL